MIAAPELLTDDHDVSEFDCSKPMLDEWLRRHAHSNQRNDFTRVFVIGEGKRVIGYCGLAPTSVPPPLLSRGIRTGRPPNPVPCILIGQLAVHREYKGRGVGSALVRHALERCVSAADTICGRAIVLSAIDADDITFWKSWGFSQSDAEDAMLFRSIRDVRAWLAYTP